MTTDILAGSPAAGLDPRLNAGIPSGPIEQKWGRHKFDLKLVNPSNRRKYTILFVGTGLAGGAGAASLGELGFQVRSFTYNDSARRAHSSVDAAMKRRRALPRICVSMVWLSCEAINSPIR